MARTFYLIAVAVLLLAVAVPVEAPGQEKRGKNHTTEEAAKWVTTAGDRFALHLYGSGGIELVLTTDKDAGPSQATIKYFLITKEDAASIVQALVDCGMWSRPDTLPEHPFGRFLSVGTRGGRDMRAWRLGGPSDDVSSMVIIQHLQKASRGERQQALKDWLSSGLRPEKK